MKILVVDDEKDMEVLFQQRFRKEIRDNEVQFAFAESVKKPCTIYLSLIMKPY